MLSATVRRARTLIVRLPLVVALVPVRVVDEQVELARARARDFEDLRRVVLRGGGCDDHLVGREGARHFVEETSEDAGVAAVEGG